MTLALTGARREAGVSVVEVNLTFIWDVISQIKVGERGRAYVIDEQSRLIAHPDISLVLSNSDLGHLAQVRAARASASEPAPELEPVKDIQGDRVLSAYAAVPTLGWLVFVELPVAEAYARSTRQSDVRERCLLSRWRSLCWLAFCWHAGW